MNSNIKLSIIIPYYNGDKFYIELLSSIRQSLLICAHLNYSYEVITMIDSMETEFDEINQINQSIFQKMDSLTFILKKNNRNLGVAISRNLAIEIATGEFLHLIDQDDQVHQSFYATILPLTSKFNFLMMNGVAHYTSTRYNSHKLLYLEPDLSIKGLLKDDFIRSPGQVVFAKQLVEKVRFPEPKTFKGADDRFFWLRIFFKQEQFLKVCYIKEPLYQAFIHDNNYSADSVNLRKSSLENWNILLSEMDISKYESLIRSDINSLKFAAKEKMDLLSKFSGAYHRFMYFLHLNKIIRFYFKRIKPSRKKSFSY